MRGKILNIIIEMSGCKKEKALPEARLKEDLGMDKLDQVEFVMALDDEFKIEISDEEFMGVRTVEDVIELVMRKEGVK